MIGLLVGVYQDGFRQRPEWSSGVRIFVIISIATVVFFMCGCVSINSANNSSGHEKEVVMTEGMTISIDSPYCTSLTVVAGKGLERRYSWNGGKRSVVLSRRDRKWNGTYGAVYPRFGELTYVVSGTTMLLVEESVLNYKNYDQLLCAISDGSNVCHDIYWPTVKTTDDIRKIDFENGLPGALNNNDCAAYTDDGLYIAAKETDGPGDGKTLYVTIHKLLFNGASVKILPGSDNNRIKIIAGNM